MFVCWAGRLVSVSRAVVPLALCLSGCVLDHEQAAPGIAIPARFSQAGQETAPPPRDWLASFGSAEMTRLGGVAEAQNLDIKAAVARIEQADAQAEVTAAALYPTLTANGVASQTYSPPFARSIQPPYKPLHSPLFGLTFTAAYQLDFWGKNRDSAQSAQLNAQAARFDRDVVALSTEAALANLYFQLLEAQDRLTVARNNVDLATRVLRAVRARKSVGTSSVLDEAQQETIVAQQRAAIPPLEQAIAQTRNTIAVLLGRTPETSHVAGGSLLRLRVPAIRAGLPAQLLSRRPDVAEAEAKFAAQGFAVDAARAALLPGASLSGTNGLLSETAQNLFNGQAAAYSIAASLAQPILDGGALEGQLNQQRGRYTELLEDYRKQILTALADVENGLVGVKQTQERLRLQGEAVVASRKGFDAAELLLSGGTIDIVTLATTENAYFQALDSEVQARAACFQAATALFLALGGGWSWQEIAALTQ